MTMRISKKKESVQGERTIIQEMSNYFTTNKFDSTNLTMVGKLEEYLYRIFAINMKDIG